MSAHDVSLIPMAEQTFCKADPLIIPQPLRVLFAALHAKHVRYCHWKSNIRLHQALAGEEDIDLLVHRRDACLFQAALAEAGFKRASSRASIGHPGVFHALALDEANGRLVHVHGYLQIVGGDSLVKSYRLPIEELLLTDCRLLHGVPTPTPEVELATFMLRVALKHASLAEVVMANRNYSAVLEELKWLRGLANERDAEQLFVSLVPNSSSNLFNKLLAAIERQQALGSRIWHGLGIARRLRRLRRLGPIAIVGSRMWRTAVLAKGRLFGRKDNMLESGGIIVALVGPKATGKSTLVNALAKRLGRHLDVMRIHAGKPPVTALTLGPQLFVPLARRLFPNERSDAHEAHERRKERAYSLLYVVRMALLAYDRRALLRRSQRAAAAGAIVISDRYPSSTTGAIDSSCFDTAALAACRRPLMGWLMERERELYDQIPHPGLVLRLEAPIETTIQRDAERSKPEGPDPLAVRRRWDLETRAEFADTPVVRIHTNATLEETVRAAIKAVWAYL
jgi:thymidylate kinase